jgi:hypothetical protein
LGREGRGRRWPTGWMIMGGFCSPALGVLSAQIPALGVLFAQNLQIGDRGMDPAACINKTRFPLIVRVPGHHAPQLASGFECRFPLRLSRNAIPWPDVHQSRLVFFCCAALPCTRRRSSWLNQEYPPGRLTKIPPGCPTRDLQGQNEGVNVTEGCFSKMDLDADGVISKWEFEAFRRFPPSRSSRHLIWAASSGANH